MVAAGAGEFERRLDFPARDPAATSLQQAAQDARTSGDRGLLLRYLRLRRAG